MSVLKKKVKSNEKSNLHRVHIAEVPDFPEDSFADLSKTFFKAGAYSAVCSSVIR